MSAPRVEPLTPAKLAAMVNQPGDSDAREQASPAAPAVAAPAVPECPLPCVLPPGHDGLHRLTPIPLVALHAEGEAPRLEQIRSRVIRAEGYAKHLKDVSSVMLAERYADDVPWLLAALANARAQLEGALRERDEARGVAQERDGLMVAAVEERDALATRLDGAVNALEEAVACVRLSHTVALHAGRFADCPEAPCSRARAALALARVTT